MVAYIDDIAVYSKDWKNHVTDLDELLNKIDEAGLTLRGDKYSIGAKKCVILGFKVGGGSVDPTEDKLEAIRNFPHPKTKKDLKAWLGLTGWM